MDKSIGAIIDGELKKIDDEQKSLAAKEEKLKQRIVKGKEAVRADEKELGTVQTCILEIERERGRVIKRALAEAGIKLDPAAVRTRTAGGGLQGLRNGAPKTLLEFVRDHPGTTTSAMAEAFSGEGWAKRIPVIVSQVLAKRGRVSSSPNPAGRGFVFTITETGKADLG